MEFPRMTVAERDAFLAEPNRIGVISIVNPNPERPPLSVPIWYTYDPAVGVSIMTAPLSAKGKALHKAKAYTMVVQDTDSPRRYVSVEGPVVEERPAERERDLRPLARRYMSPEDADKYVASYQDGAFGHMYVMSPRVWLTNDIGKF